MSASTATSPRKKKTLIAAGLALLLVAGGGAAAFAYWTNLGSGSGTASTGNNASIVIKQTSTVTNLRPGGPAVVLAGNFDNPNDSPVYVANVVVGTLTVTKATGAPAGTCDATDYTITGGTMAVNAQVPTGTAQGAWTGATIQFNNKPAVNQDACKGATISIAYSSN